MKIDKNLFGRLPDKRDVYLYHISVGNGIEARFCELGAVLVGLTVPDRAGNPTDVVLGFDRFEDYLHDNSCYGAVVGRFANRIHHARFTLDGVEYRLHANDHGNALHGGKHAFHRVLWKSAAFENESGAGVEFSYFSGHMEDGFPGNLNVEVTYTLSPQGALAIDYRAQTDRRTHLNLTQHAYFNLGGMKRDALDHEITINSRAITENDLHGIPTGKILDIAGTAFDLVRPVPIGKAIAGLGNNGFDNNYILIKNGGELALAATVVAPESGIVMETVTTEPGVQFYTGNHLHGVHGKTGIRYGKHWGFCLETQHYPDSPHHPEFPSTLLDPGNTFTSRTIYRFSVACFP